MHATDARRLGFDPDRLARIDRFLADKYLRTGLLPHAQLLVARDGEIAHFSSQGPARAEGNAPVDERSLFRIASMTKPITSVAFMALVEEGRVALDDPVHRVLPEFEGLRVYRSGGAGAPFVTAPAPEPMRMVDLMRHTSGLTYGFQHRSNVDAAYRERGIGDLHGEHDLGSFVAALAELPLEFAPGGAWTYSVATDVLGAVIERIEGRPLEEVLRSRIFEPLGMADTGFHVPADASDRLTDCWTADPARGRVLHDRGRDGAWTRPPRLLSGGGGLVSSALDYHRFCAMLLGGGALGGRRVLGRKTLELMTRNHLPGGADLAGLSRSMFSETQYAGTGFGLGVAVTLDPARALLAGSAGEFHWGGMFSTAFFVDPAERLSVVFMTQLAPSSLHPVRRELRTMIHAALT